MTLLEGYIDAIRNAPHGKQVREPTADGCELVRYLTGDYVDTDYFNQSVAQLRMAAVEAYQVLDKIQSDVELAMAVLMKHLLIYFNELYDKHVGELAENPKWDIRHGAVLEAYNFKNKRILEITREDYESMEEETEQFLEEVKQIYDDAVAHIREVYETLLVILEEKILWRVIAFERVPFRTWYTYDYELTPILLQGKDYRIDSIREEITTEVMDYGDRYRMHDTKEEDGASLISGDDYRLNLENNPIASHYHETEENRMYAKRANGR